ncbi:hypothetical protein PYCCODRAFT_337252 [Trametes coccinea BRFM310]|uniref:Uncharacterized protein n=1 Tax=Trametes coccinea (strain BRFM310) TaxID=1353009 RepID=A0A1Y2J2L9_TRAC3|nr:hypothetical protein PYCCODRAFT_337252 [Trametes coccinea BRFM310]
MSRSVLGAMLFIRLLVTHTAQGYEGPDEEVCSLMPKRAGDVRIVAHATGRLQHDPGGPRPRIAGIGASLLWRDGTTGPLVLPGILFEGGEDMARR